MIVLPLLCALVAPPTPSVVEVELVDLVRYADRVVVGRVEQVVQLEREPVDGRRTGFGTATSLPFADLTVLEVWKGEPLDTALILAAGTWTCDVTKAVPGETAVWFLDDADALADEGPRLVEGVQRRFGERRVRSVLWAGRGRMPLRTEDGERLAACRDPVRLPDDLGARRRSRPESYLTDVPVAALRERVQETVVRQRGPYLRAMSARRGPPGREELGWTLELRRDRRMRLAVLDANGLVAHERASVLPAMTFYDLQQAVHRIRGPRWNAALGGPGSSDEGLRSLDLTAPGRTASIRIFELSTQEIVDHAFREEVREALELWSAVRSLVDEPGLVDRRAADRSLLERYSVTNR